MRSAFLIGAWLGLLAGLLEGPLSILLMRTGHLREVWWDILWIAPVVDAGLAIAAACLLAILSVALRRPQLQLSWAVFGSGFFTASVCLGLLLPYQVHTWALLLLSAGIASWLARMYSRNESAALGFFRRTLWGLASVALILTLVIRPGGFVREKARTSRLPGAAPGAPDVLVIVIDALRADHVHDHGYARPTTPTLDSIAATGATFLGAFSSAPYTAPSHASLLTGLMPSEHGVQWRERSPVLRRGIPTLPEKLARLGYRTGAFSGNRFWFTREQGFGRGFLHFEDRYWSVGDMVAGTAYGRKLVDLILKRWLLDYPWRRDATEITDSFLKWATAGTDGPFFAMLNYFDVHDPYLPPESFDSLPGGRVGAAGLINSFREDYDPELTPAQLQAEIDAYDRTLTYVDQEVSRLLTGLRHLEQPRDLLLIVTSDHGEAFAEHGTYIHANSLYLEEIHVPLIISYASRVPANFRSGVPVTNASIPATIIELATGNPADPAMAPSLVPLWRDSASIENWPSPVSEMEHWPWMHEAAPSHFGALTSIQGAQYHYISNDSLGISLFDWRQDPREQRDLAGLPGYTDALERFGALIQK